MTEKEISYKPKKSSEKKPSVDAVVVLMKGDGRLIVSVDGKNTVLGKKESEKYANTKRGDKIKL